LLLILLIFALAVRSRGDNDCVNDELDWYTSATGETPCQTYEKLRQICNPEFKVGILNTSLPPDQCDDVA
ncbi:hypothetical protein GYMLUDRAFT_83157, partial [Collybiopsis luxurians FD-317 M1]